jgi:hypothetical protein
MGAPTTAAACASSPPVAARSFGAGTATTRPKTRTSRWERVPCGRGKGFSAGLPLHLVARPRAACAALAAARVSLESPFSLGHVCAALPSAGLAEEARAGPQGDNGGAVCAVQHTPARGHYLHSMRRRVWCAPAGPPPLTAARAGIRGWPPSASGMASACCSYAPAAAAVDWRGLLTPLPPPPPPPPQVPTPASSAASLTTTSTSSPTTATKWAGCGCGCGCGCASGLRMTVNGRDIQRRAAFFWFRAWRGAGRRRICACSNPAWVCGRLDWRARPTPRPARCAVRHLPHRRAPQLLPLRHLRLLLRYGAQGGGWRGRARVGGRVGGWGGGFLSAFSVFWPFPPGLGVWGGRWGRVGRGLGHVTAESSTCLPHAARGGPSLASAPSGRDQSPPPPFPLQRHQAPPTRRRATTSVWSAPCTRTAPSASSSCLRAWTPPRCCAAGTRYTRNACG